MDYKKEIKKHKLAIDNLYKQQKQEQIKGYYVIFACLDEIFISSNGKKYYVNSLNTVETTPLDYSVDVKRCLFTKQEAIDFANKSKEPKILKTGIKPANQEIPASVDFAFLEI